MRRLIVKRRHECIFSNDDECQDIKTGEISSRGVCSSRRRRCSGRGIPHVDLIRTTMTARNILLELGDGLLLLLHNDLSRVEFDQHSAICFKLLHGNGQPEIVQEQKL